ncbi:hypothetical protein FIBSPDRAFT_879370, partial [Athelia psychrophila]
ARPRTKMRLLSLKYAKFRTEMRSILGLKYAKNPDKDRGEFPGAFAATRVSRLCTAETSSC